MINGTDHPYGYNGKEEQDELGLDWMDFHARNYDASLGRWMNIDPLAEKFYSNTPYIAMLNNPLSYIDPDGRYTLKVSGDDADLAVSELDEDSSLSLSRDSNTDIVSINNKDKVDYASLNTKDKRLYDTIEDKNKTVNLSTTRDLKRKDGLFTFGKHNGQTLTDASQEVNMEQAINLENNGGDSAGTIVFHEIDEGYSAMEIVNATSIVEDVVTAITGISLPKLSPTRNVFDAAHTRASSHDSNFTQINTNQFHLQTTVSPNVLWFNLNPSANPSSNGWFKLN
ncbi:RHS repeat-associated core domain-containing protein [Psychroserpens sp.]